MEFKCKTRVTVNLKGSGYLSIHCTRVGIIRPSNPLSPVYYIFQFHDETIAQVPAGIVDSFYYFKSIFDMDPVYFEVKENEQL